MLQSSNWTFQSGKYSAKIDVKKHEKLKNTVSDNW